MSEVFLKKNRLNTEINPPFDKSRLSLTFSYLLSNALLQMKPMDTDKTELITFCRAEYKDNESQLNIIDKFERNYTSERATYW